MEHLIQQAALKIATARQPVSFSGAGLSAESGIATFRSNADDASDEDVLWSKFDPMTLASQQGFAANPAMVIDWYNWRRKTLASVTPNDAHRTLALQTRWTHITQNVDNLLELAGAKESSVLHLHGTLLEDHCNAGCGYSEKVNLEHSMPLRECQCGGQMRPSVVWFGESLPAQILQTAIQKTEVADLMLVVGTSAQVYPAASLIDIAKSNDVEVIVVNTESSGVESANVIELVGPAGELLPKIFATG